MNNTDLQLEGIAIQGKTAADITAAKQNFQFHLRELGLEPWVEMVVELNSHGYSLHSRVRQDLACEWAPDGDTTQLCQKLKLNTEQGSADLEKEILLAMLMCPITLDFPSYDELASAVRIRKNIVEAARKTVLAFDTQEAERPEDYWAYSETGGFTILPGKSLIAALQKATQPSVSGRLYSFSCYRATEYVILLAVAQELRLCNPELFRRLHEQWEVRAIKSGEFHDAFLREYGSMDTPLPPKYYVPGDRLWFRNPDPYSSDVTGYEGSWVFYLGGGLFSNFWKPNQPYTLTAKCLELFHWRNAVCWDPKGHLCMDEKIVEDRVRSSMNNPVEVEEILQRMLKFRDPKGIYAQGGCIDTSREYPCCVRPDTFNLVLDVFTLKKEMSHWTGSAATSTLN